MSFSQALRNLRDESEEEEIDQLPLQRFVQPANGKNPSSPRPKTSHGSSPPKDLGRKLLTTLMALRRPLPLKSPFSSLSLLHASATCFSVRIPSFDDRPQRPPANHQTWFLEHFFVGLIPPVLTFYTSACAQYDVAPNQLHPNSICYLTGFYLVYMWMGVEPTARHFQAYFLILNTNPFHFLSECLE